jgi:hypothetical protein
MRFADAVRRTLIGVVVALSPSAPVQAQASLPPASSGEPRWDASGGFSLLWTRTADVADAGNGSVGASQLRLDVGRYWTRHLKLGFFAASGPRLRTTAREDLNVNGRPLSTVIVTRARQVTLAPGLTYQFRDNQFLHPYVTAGLQISRLRMHREISPYTVRPPDPLPPIDEWRNATRVRPFASVGFKAYFNQRVFVRPEVHGAFGPDGLSQFTLHLGAGADF